jgi:hypothetical protein
MGAQRMYGRSSNCCGLAADGLAIEDLHWADDSTRLLAFLVATPSRARAPSGHVPKRGFTRRHRCCSGSPRPTNPASTDQLQQLDRSDVARQRSILGRRAV